jgi:hypothetical protein
MKEILTQRVSIQTNAPAKPSSLHKEMKFFGVVLVLLFVVGFIASALQGPSSPLPAAPMAAVPFAPNLPEKRILFVGNSYTYSHQMPMMVQNLLNATPSRAFNYRVDMIAEPKANLKKHIENNIIVPRLQQNKYEMVFLQEQSTTAFYSNEALVSEANFALIIKKAKEAGARVAVFSPWPRRADNEFYSGRVYSNLDRPEDPAVMSRSLYNFYQNVATQNQVDHIPLSRYFYSVMKRHPDINLHAADGTHPTKTGSYFMALAAYQHILGELPEQVWRPIGVGGTHADIFLRLLSAQ